MKLFSILSAGAFAHLSNHTPTPVSKLNTLIIEGVGENKDNQGALRILKLSLLGNGCPGENVRLLLL